MPARAPARPANTFSAASLGVLGGHLALLLATHVILVGIMPIGFAVKALRRHEPLAPVAMAVARPRLLRQPGDLQQPRPAAVTDR